MIRLPTKLYARAMAAAKSCMRNCFAVAKEEAVGPGRVHDFRSKKTRCEHTPHPADAVHAEHVQASS